MSILSPGALRELAKFLWDVSKLTATAAFITPYFTGANIESHIIIGMAVVAIATFFAGLFLHYVTDHLESRGNKGERGKVKREGWNEKEKGIEEIAESRRVEQRARNGRRRRKRTDK